jgi:DNA-binding response OmpR family regulator
MRVLIVDDADSANALGKLLRGAGHSCDQALDTSQAVAVAATYHFDVAFIDVGLADHGAEALASVLKEKGIKCIALTRFGAAPARFSGFDGMIPKPVNVRDLLSILNRFGP